MRVLIIMGLVVLNAVLSAMNLSVGNIGISLFNAFTAGVCLAIAIVIATGR